MNPEFGKAAGFGLLVFAGLVLLFGIPTAVITNPWFIRMTPVRSIDYAFLFLNSALLGVYGGIWKLQRTQSRNASATTGGVFNFLAVGCPVCNKLLVLLLGTSVIMTYIEPLRIWFGIAGIGLVSTAIFLKLKTQFCVNCQAAVKSE